MQLTASQSRAREDAVGAFVDACRAVAEAAEACANACTQSGRLDHFRRCIALASDCAEMCRTTAGIAARGQTERRGLKAMVRATCALCELFAAECGRLTSDPACAAAHVAATRCVSACRKAAATL
jgi:hypothetical protein